MKTKKRAMKAIGRYLELKGYEVLEEGWCHGKDKVDYIVDDCGCIAFVFGHAEENVGNGIPMKPIDRKKFERLAAAYLAEHPEHADCEVRADADPDPLGQPGHDLPSRERAGRHRVDLLPLADATPPPGGADPSAGIAQCRKRRGLFLRPWLFTSPCRGGWIRLQAASEICLPTSRKHDRRA